MEILSRWKLKKINSDVPLYDSEKRTYMIIIEGNMVEIPEDVFLKMFKRIEIINSNANVDIMGNNETAEDYKEAHPQVDPNIPHLLFGGKTIPITPETMEEHTKKLKEVIRMYINLGMSKEGILEHFLNTGIQNFELSEEQQERIKKGLEKLYNEILEE